MAEVNWLSVSMVICDVSFAEQPYAVLKAAEVTAVVVDNQAIDAPQDSCRQTEEIH